MKILPRDAETMISILLSEDLAAVSAAGCPTTRASIVAFIREAAASRAQASTTPEHAEMMMTLRALADAVEAKEDVAHR